MRCSLHACYLGYVNQAASKSVPVGPQSFAASLHQIFIAVSNANLNYLNAPTA